MPPAPGAGAAPALPGPPLSLGPRPLAALALSLSLSLCLAQPAGAWPAARQKQGAASSAAAPVGALAGSAIEVTGARVLDSGLLEPLPPRPQAPVRTGPATLVGGVDGIGAVVATPGEPLPRELLKAPPEREYRPLASAAKVYAAPGQALGFGYVLAGSPLGAAVPVQVAVLLPVEREGAPRRVETLEREAVLGRPDWAAWEFGDAVEPGQYVIELRCQGAVLARRAFVVVPRRQPGPLNGGSPR